MLAWLPHRKVRAPPVPLSNANMPAPTVISKVCPAPKAHLAGALHRGSTRIVQGSSTRRQCMQAVYASSTSKQLMPYTHKHCSTQGPPAHLCTAPPAVQPLPADPYNATTQQDSAAHHLLQLCQGVLPAQNTHHNHHPARICFQATLNTMFSACTNQKVQDAELEAPHGLHGTT
jgi:hypothetical protein